MKKQNLQEIVKEKYGAAALQAAAGGVATCGTDLSCCDSISTNLYDSSQIAGVPQKAVAASLGSGNPTALAQLPPGETVLDLGSGGGIDVLLTAKRVGPSGKAGLVVGPLLPELEGSTTRYGRFKHTKRRSPGDRTN